MNNFLVWRWAEREGANFRGPEYLRRNGTWTRYRAVASRLGKAEANTAAGIFDGAHVEPASLKSKQWRQEKRNV